MINYICKKPFDIDDNVTLHQGQVVRISFKNDTAVIKFYFSEKDKIYNECDKTLSKAELKDNFIIYDILEHINPKDAMRMMAFLYKYKHNEQHLLHKLIEYGDRRLRFITRDAAKQDD